MSYNSDIESIGHICLDDIIQTAKKYVPMPYRNQPWSYPGQEHGTACLENDAQLCCYLASYGEMHKGKLDRVMEDFPFDDLDVDFEIIDWGCGQGIATISFLDHIRNLGLSNKLKKITLIEPSKAALKRAKFNVCHAIDINEVHIDTLNYFLPSTKTNDKSINGLHIEEPICIHLFSNILDIPSIDLKELSIMIGSSGYRHYFLCVGPMNFGNNRIEAFSQYFHIKDKSIFSDVHEAQYGQITNGKWYSCVAMGFQVTREDGKPFLVPLAFYPPKQFHASYRLDAFEPSEVTPKEKAYWNRLSAFEVLAPFDIGASIYDDINPVFAVLSNLITRGLPTRCSSFIEERLNDIFAFSSKIEQYGSVKYILADKNNFDSNNELLRKVPICVARMQKTIIEALITNRISIDNKKWKVLVKECDVPCTALAFEDLKIMFNHLTGMTKEYDTIQFPEVELHILSPQYSDSKLHLGKLTYSRVSQINREQLFDMVIDIAIDMDIDAENVQFSEFKAKNDCYFNVRSSKTVYTAREIYTSDVIQYNPIIGKETSEISEEQKSHLEYFLNLLFRKVKFRPGQLPILNRALQNKGVIGLLPTGGGKSLTYQLAAMLQPGITVVIDPLKSLMEDQYDGLIAAGIDCCTYINSELSTAERSSHEQMMESSQVIFIFMSPERLCIYEFRGRLQNMHDLNIYFSYGVIDEVHCVSEWGQDFRFSYLHLGRNLYSYVRSKKGRITLFGLTATASFDVLADVERELSGNGAFELDPDTIVRYENSNRLELQYKIERVEVEYKEDQYFDKNNQLAGYPRAVNIGDNWSAYDQKKEFLADYIKKVPNYIRELQSEEALERILSGFRVRENVELSDALCLRVDMPDDFYEHKNEYEQAGIIFCPHVNSSGISVDVNSKTLSSICEVGTFSGSSIEGQTMGDKSMENMRKFRDNKVPIMVATKAFGMGIDKPNVRFTINLNYSSSLESFVQEAGRAGRDHKMALAVIFMSDYHLVRVNKNCPNNTYPLGIIKSKWFKEDDLQNILDDFGITLADRYIDKCDPLTDIVKLKCKTDNSNKTWNCTTSCSKYKECSLRFVDKKMRGWQYQKDLIDYLRVNRIRIPKDCIEYQGADYSTVMYFFDNNFKGEFEEKKKMFDLLSVKNMSYFIGNDRKYKYNETKNVNGFLSTVLDAKVGTEVVTLIAYDDDSYADIAKAIYRMCIIGLIDDFTQDYSNRTFRILSTRKKNGQYYERLKAFLMRYYSEDRAENEVEKASVHSGQNEIHKCLGYLTEFIYDKVALKRKRAIDDMRRFCLIGIDQSKDWKVINEELKNEIYYYFNSKYAREDYKTDNGENFSLLNDTNSGKDFSFDTLFKYMRVVDADVIGTSGSPKDNIKHLQGAIRLIRRSETDVNAALCLLNVFCLLALKIGNNQNMQEELDDSFLEGYYAFKEKVHDIDAFYAGINKFKKELNENNRNIASNKDLAHLDELAMQAELSEHIQWIEQFVQNYNN